MTLEKAIEIICDDYCKFPNIESGNRLADICDSCPFNKCEDLRWADHKTESNSGKPNNSTISKMEQVDKDINVRCKDEPQTCSVSGRPYSECADCEYFKCTADEPQTELKGSKRLLKGKDEPQTEYERASEQREHDILYEPTYNENDGSM